MEKIVILSNAGKGKSPLAKSLQMMFPESDVQVVAKKRLGADNLAKIKNQEDANEEFILNKKACGL